MEDVEKEHLDLIYYHYNYILILKDITSAVFEGNDRLYLNEQIVLLYKKIYQELIKINSEILETFNSYMEGEVFENIVSLRKIILNKKLNLPEKESKKILRTLGDDCFWKNSRNTKFVEEIIGIFEGVEFYIDEFMLDDIGEEVKRYNQHIDEEIDFGDYLYEYSDKRLELQDEILSHLKVSYEKLGLFKYFLEKNFDLNYNKKYQNIVEHARYVLHDYKESFKTLLVNEILIYPGVNFDQAIPSWKKSDFFSKDSNDVLEEEVENIKTAANNYLYKYSVIGIYAVMEKILSEYLVFKDEDSALRMAYEISRYRDNISLERLEFVKIIKIAHRQKYISYALKEELIKYKFYRNLIHLNEQFVVKIPYKEVFKRILIVYKNLLDELNIQ